MDEATEETPTWRWIQVAGHRGVEPRVWSFWGFRNGKWELQFVSRQIPGSEEFELSEVGVKLPWLRGSELKCSEKAETLWEERQ